MTETYSTSGLPHRARAAAWNEVYSRKLAHVDFVPANQDGFNAELRLSTLGPIGFARMTSDRTSIARTTRHIGRTSGRLYSFMLQSRGSGVFAHCGHEAILHEGDFTLCDSTAPHSYLIEDASEVVMLRVPADVLRTYLPSPEQFCGRRLSASEGLTGTAAAMVGSLCRQVEMGFDPDYENRVARHLLDVMATAYSMGFDRLPSGSAVVSGRHARVKRYIEENLRDPALSPCTIAAGLKMSSRYLRMIFSISNETISAYILRRRLEESAKQIRDPNWRGHTITEIAFGWGFNSAAHFARSFRERYGIAPRDYRRN
jgi:AraC family transcriptional activator of tynA and feaB